MKLQGQLGLHSPTVRRVGKEGKEEEIGSEGREKKGEKGREGEEGGREGGKREEGRESSRIYKILKSPDPTIVPLWFGGWLREQEYLTLPLFLFGLGLDFCLFVCLFLTLTQKISKIYFFDLNV